MRISREGRLGKAAKVLMPLALLALGATAGLAPRQAEAQSFDWGGGWAGSGWGNGQDWGGIRPAQIYRMLGERGFRVLAPLSRDGAVFVADVVDRRGRRERLVVSAADGQIVRRFVYNTDRHLQRSAGLPTGDDLEQQMEGADRFDGPPPIPPATIPDTGGYGRDVRNPDEDNTIVEPVQPRPAPRLVRPVRPRLVERTPDLPAMEPDSVPPTQPTRLKAKPSQPLRLPVSPDSASDRPSAPATVTASRPAEGAIVPASPAPAASPSSAAASPPSSRMRDPLAIPRSEPKSADVPKASASASSEPSRKIAPGTVTGAPAAETLPLKPTKAGDVPVAPLD